MHAGERKEFLSGLRYQSKVQGRAKLAVGRRCQQSAGQGTDSLAVAAQNGFGYSYRRIFCQMARPIKNGPICCMKLEVCRVRRIA